MSSVSCQLSQNSSRSSPAIVSALRIAVVIADELPRRAGSASNVNFEISRPGGVRVVVGRRQRQQLVDQLAAQVEHDAMAGPRHAVLGHERARGRAAGTRATTASGSRSVIAGSGFWKLLDDRHHHVRHQRVAGGDDDHADDGQRERPPVGADVAQQAPVEVSQAGATRQGRAWRPARGSGLALARMRGIERARDYSAARPSAASVGCARVRRARRQIAIEQHELQRHRRRASAAAPLRARVAPRAARALRHRVSVRHVRRERVDVARIAHESRVVLERRARRRRTWCW